MILKNVLFIILSLNVSFVPFSLCRLEHCVYKCPCMCFCSVWDALTDNYIPSSVSSWDDPTSETLNGNFSDQEVNGCSALITFMVLTWSFTAGLLYRLMLSLMQWPSKNKYLSPYNWKNIYFLWANDCRTIWEYSFAFSIQGVVCIFMPNGWQIQSLAAKNPAWSTFSGNQPAPSLAINSLDSTKN